MKSLTLNLLIAGIIGITLFSCQQPLYVPNTLNVPILTKTGDLDATFSTGSNGWDLQAGYAINDNLGIMVNSSFADNTSDSTSNYNKHTFVEGGVGYSLLMNKKTYEPGQTRYVFSVFGGVGLGSSSGSYSYTELFTNKKITNINSGNYIRPFIQPNIGIVAKNVHMMVSNRVSFVKFSQITSGYNLTPVEITEFNRDHNLYMEPTLTMRFGPEKVKFLWQIGASVGQYNTEITAFRNRPLIFIIGMHFNSNIFEKKE